MSTMIQYVLYLAILVVLAIPLGAYIKNVMSGEKTFLSKVLTPCENLIYKVTRVDREEQMTWKKYAVSVMIFSGIGLVFLFLLQLLQGVLPGNPQNLSGVKWDLAFNTSASFITNTNWQAYSGESTLSYLTQALGLTVQNFVSAATGIAVLFALIRGFIKVKSSGLGSFWVDLTRIVVHILLPLNLVIALLLVGGGVIQNLKSAETVSLVEPIAVSAEGEILEDAVIDLDTETVTVDGEIVSDAQIVTEQFVPMGPAASQVAIKQTGTNGGGYMGVNSAHPLENPNAFTNLIEMISILLIPAALCFTFGSAVKNKKQGVAIFMAMFLCLVVALGCIAVTEQVGTPQLAQNGAVNMSIVVLLVATLIGCGFDALGFTESNIIAVYILGVLVTAVITTNRLCGILTSVVSVLVFNFFFTTPRLTFHFDDPNYIVTFTIMFIVTLLSGSLATRLKENAKQSAHTAYRTKILFETNQLLQKEQDENAVISATAGQLMKLLKKDIVVYLSDGKELATPNVFRAVNSIQEDLISENEKAVAGWVFRNNKHAGATTDTLSSAKCLYLAIRVNQHVYGVAGIAVNGIPLDSFENSVLLSILGECALALENIKNAKEKEEAAVLAQNEQLRANLLRAISHDLRTPLTAISGSADNLLANYKKMDDALREQTFTDIYDDSMWLINLVENLLAVTRIEGGQVNLTRSIELMDEVVSEALKHINRKSKEHTIRVTSGKDFILAHIDAKLIVQVIINLVDNAIKYTPVGSVIEIHTDQKEQWVTVSVSDNGPGIPDEQKPRIFDMFYSGANKVVDSRRSLGLGLSLCKSIVTAHGGTISVSDNQPNGTVFTFTLPAGKVELHE